MRDFSKEEFVMGEENVFHKMIVIVKKVNYINLVVIWKGALLVGVNL